MDGVLDPARGISPFFVDMDFQAFCQALDGWSSRVLEDEYALDLELSRGDHVIKVGFSKVDQDRIGFGDLISVESETAVLAHGRRVDSLSAEDLGRALGLEFRPMTLPADQDDSLRHFEAKLGELLVCAWEEYGSVTNVMVLRNLD